MRRESVVITWGKMATAALTFGIITLLLLG
jgi:hypothetical protein